MPLVTLNPTYEKRSAQQTAAPALATLEGATVGLLDNNKKNVGTFLSFVEERLRRDHGVREVVRLRKSNMSAPAPADIMRQLTVCEAVIAAIGD
jgi:hypothetical protein